MCVNSSITRVYVSGRGSNDTAGLNRSVNQDVDWIVQHYEAILDYAVEQQLPDKNIGWVDEPGHVTMPESFKAARRLGALRFHADRQIEMTLPAGTPFRALDRHLAKRKLFEDKGFPSRVRVGKKSKWSKAVVLAQKSGEFKIRSTYEAQPSASNRQSIFTVEY